MNWQALMALGLGVLRLSPQDFWSMTPREFSAALKGVAGFSPAAAPLARADFEALAARFPDQGAV